MSLAVLLLHLGCGRPPVDPLQKDRDALRALLQRAPQAPQGWPQEASLLVGKPLLLKQLRAALDAKLQNGGQPMTYTSSYGEVLLSPRLVLEDVLFLKVNGCATCVEAQLTLSGDVGAVLQNAKGMLALMTGTEFTLPVKGSVVATFEITSTRQERATDDGGVQRMLVVNAAPRPGSWQVSLTSSSLPDAIAAEVDAWMASQFSKAIQSGRVAPVEVAQLPEQGAVRLKAVRARPARTGLVLDVAFMTLAPGHVVDLDTHPRGKSNGWVAAVSDATLLQVARAAALASPVDKLEDGDFVVEPSDVRIQDGKLTLQMRLWRYQAEPEFRTYEVDVEVRVVDDGEGAKVAFEAVDSRQVGEGGGFTLDPLQLVVRHAVLAKLSETMEQVLPAQHQNDVGDFALHTKVTDVVLDDHTLFLYGTAALRPRS